VCIHGMLGSSFGYRKVLRELASRGLRGIAWDLPGFGLCECRADCLDGTSARRNGVIACCVALPPRHQPQFRYRNTRKKSAVHIPARDEMADQGPDGPFSTNAVYISPN
jgi:hypothetical protein